MPIVDYTNVFIPLSGTGSAAITGSFSVNYDGSGGASFVSIDLHCAGTAFNDVGMATAFGGILNASNISPFSPLTTYYFRLYSNHVNGDAPWVQMLYSFDNPSGSEIHFWPMTGGAVFITYEEPDAEGPGASYNYLTGVSDVDGVLESPACFTRGVYIGTIKGQIEVQCLKIGDLLINNAGQEVLVKWIGKQRFHPRFGLENLPVCITAGALGNGLPVRDLYVSPDHAMFIDDCLLVHAKALVNGSSIYQATEWEGDVEYFHIETENHEIILAEGAPAETFIDNVSRKAFYNHAEYETLYPDAKPMIELDIPRVKYERQLPTVIKHKIDAIVAKLEIRQMMG